MTNPSRTLCLVPWFEPRASADSGPTRRAVLQTLDSHGLRLGRILPFGVPGSMPLQLQYVESEGSVIVTWVEQTVLAFPFLLISGGDPSLEARIRRDIRCFDDASIVSRCREAQVVRDVVEGVHLAGLGLSGDGDALRGILRAAAEAASPLVRQAVLASLAFRANPSYVDIVKLLVDDATPEVAEQAAMLLGALAPRA